MTLQEFTSQIQGKIFVELNGEAVSSFTSLIPAAEGGEGDAIRSAATNAGVIVFLSSIHKIFAKGMYYGCDPDAFDEAITNISNLQSSVNTLGGAISTLNDTVASQGQDITNLKTWTTEKATIISNNTTQIGELSTSLSQLESKVDNIGSDPSNPILNAIDERINTLLGFDKRDNEDPDDLVYTWDNIAQGGTFTEVVKNLQVAVDTFNTSLASKADLLDFNTLAAKIGAGETLPWWTAAEDDPHDTIVTVVNEHHNSIQNLKTEVSGIPHFSIRVVDSLPVDSIENPISRSTIYLVRKQGQSEQQEQDGETVENREMFEEYIWVNKNAATQGAQENWGWERLGSQFFNIESYVDQETLDGITADLEQRISEIVEQIGSESLSTVNSRLTTAEGNITTLQNNLSTLQTTCTSLANELHTLIENGEFKLTGEDIKTTASGNTTIAQDIADLKANKLDNTALNWVIIGESE